MPGRSRSIERKCAIPPLRDCVDGFLGRARVQAGLSPLTVVTYANDLGGFIEWCDRSAICEAGVVSPAELRRWIRDLRSSGQSPSTTDRKAAAVRTLLADCVDRGLLDENPLDPRGRRVPVEVVGESLRDLAMADVVHSMGVTPFELTRITLDDWWQAGITLRLRGRNGAERVVVVTSLSRARVERWLAEGRTTMTAGRRGSGALFVGRGGRPLRWWEVKRRTGRPRPGTSSEQVLPVDVRSVG